MTFVSSCAQEARTDARATPPPMINQSQPPTGRRVCVWLGPGWGESWREHVHAFSSGTRAPVLAVPFLERPSRPRTPPARVRSSFDFLKVGCVWLWWVDLGDDDGDRRVSVGLVYWWRDGRACGGGNTGQREEGGEPPPPLLVWSPPDQAGQQRKTRPPRQDRGPVHLGRTSGDRGPPAPPPSSERCAMRPWTPPGRGAAQGGRRCTGEPAVEHRRSVPPKMGGKGGRAPRSHIRRSRAPGAPPEL